MFDFITPWLENTWILILVLLVGFVALVKGADWVVDGASAVAKRFKVSDLIIGLTVVAFGTSLPEFVVSMISSGESNSELAITNVLGSNSINIFVVLGLTALVWPVSSKKEARKEDIPFACLGAILVFLFASVTLLSTKGGHFLIDISATDLSKGFITGFGGCIILLFFALYMVLLTIRAKDNPDDVESVESMALWKALLFLVVGLVGLTVGGEFVVKSATQVAHKMGVSDAIIGLTVVALGTSLPELVTSVMAAIKKKSDLALGNCVGSCTFNIFFVLAVSALIHPLSGYNGMLLDAAMAFAGPFIVWLWVMISKKHQVDRLCGALLLLLYAAYLIYRIVTV